MATIRVEGDAAEAPAAEHSHRREFLCKIGALASAGALLPLVQACETAEMHTPAPVLGEKLDFDVTKDPYKPLAVVGGKAKVTIGGTDILLLRTSETQILAYKNLCPHQQCPLEFTATWDTASSHLSCSCHGAVFDATGKVVKWPDPTGSTPAKVYKVTFTKPTGTVQT